MREKLATALLAAALMSSSGSACAMSSSESPQPRCRVIGGEKLPEETGGAETLCAAIAQAATARAAGVNYSVEVRVLSRSRLSANVVLSDGVMLREQNLATMDRDLSRSSIERFAQAIAAELARAAAR